MIQALGQGVLSGLMLAMLLGPAFFAIIQVSVSRGFLAGFFLALGISLSDTIYIALAHMGMEAFVKETPWFHSAMGFLGGLVLCVAGLGAFLRKRIRQKVGQNKTDQSFIQLFAKGFAVNFFSPFVPIFWVGVAGVVNMQADYTPQHEFVHYAGLIITVLGTDTLKALLSHRLSNVLTFRRMFWFNRIVSSGFIMGGLGLIVYGVIKLPV